MKKRPLLPFLIFLAILIHGCGTEPGTIENIRLTEDTLVSIGYIGCSNTRETVEGYHYMGGKKMWSYEKRYDSGSVVEWAKNAEQGNKYWDVFDELLRKYPETKYIWFELCIPDSERGTSEYHTEIILNEIRKRIPEAKIYASALADYTGGVCHITGTWGLEKGKELVKKLDEKNEDVFLGPILGPMTPEDTAKDGCHLSSPDGKRKLGEQIKQFFDSPSLSEPAAEIAEEPIANEDIETDEDIEEELSFEEQIWRQRIEKSMAPSECPAISKPDYPASYYQGTLIDTHLHLPAIPDSMPEEGDKEDEENYDEEENEEGAFGGPQAVLGQNVKMSQIACTLEREGTMKNFAFFPIYDHIYLQSLEIANKTMQLYPTLFTPFIMPPTEDTPTVEAKVLQKMLAVHPGLFQGYGEVGSSPTEAKDPPPDDRLYLENYKLAKGHHLLVYYHLGHGHKENFKRVLATNPDMNFIWHGDQLSIDEIEDVLSKYPNAYYGVETMGEGSDFGIFRLFVGKSKDAYLDAMEQNFDDLLNYDVRKRKAMIERHPNQVIWGTDRGDAVWNYDVEVGQIMVKYARAFIGKLDPKVQERFAYQNAERLINASGKGK